MFAFIESIYINIIISTIILYITQLADAIQEIPINFILRKCSKSINPTTIIKNIAYTIGFVIESAFPNAIKTNNSNDAVKEIVIILPKYLRILSFVIKIGTETELVLKSRWVLPERLIKSGYTFVFPKVKDAIANIKK